jgi:hypothetical protein
MRVIIRIVAVLLIAIGSVWFLQGVNVLPGSFMTRPDPMGRVWCDCGGGGNRAVVCGEETDVEGLEDGCVELMSGVRKSGVSTSRSDWLKSGALLIACAITLWLVFEGLAYYGQTPGEKDLGLGVLAMLFIIPAIILGTCGL